MRHGRLPLFLAFVLFVGLVAADDELEQTDEAVETSDDTETSEPPPLPPPTLLPVPKITLAQPRMATEAEAEEIRELIGDLDQIEAMDQVVAMDLAFGYFTGAGFAALPPKVESNILELKLNPSFKKLVEYGPKALPFVLEALDDNSPTKWTLWFPPTGYRLGGDLPRNQVNTSEVAAITRVEQVSKRGPSSHTVKVGDICFILLGQITNRGYMITFDNPTGSFVNSPVEDKSLAKKLRDIWGETDHAQKLFQFLLIDFQTRGDFMRLQSGAAKRLTFYFPDEASTLIADALNGLDVTAKDYGEQWLANGIDAVGLIGDVSWSADPRIATAIFDIFNKTTEEAIALACVPGIGKQHDGVIFDRLIEFLKKQKPVEEGIVAHQHSLQTIGERFPDRAKKVFQEYLEANSACCRQDLCYVLGQTCGKWSIDLLSELLDDRSKTNEVFLGAADSAGPLPMRICDLATQTISMNFPNLKFEVTGKPGEMDRQIAEIKQKIAEMKKIGGAADDELDQSDEAGETTNDVEPPPPPVVPLRLLPVPKITLATPTKATEAEAKEILAVIESLKQFNEVNAGLGFGIFNAAPFPPIKRAQYAQGYGVAPHRAVKKLVEYGPKAVPFLLEALTDASPTMQTFQWTDCRIINDLPRNPVNTSEAEAAKTLQAQPKNERTSQTYAATVGDICFVALGQITNRCYSPFGTDEPEILVVNSPVENETLARSIRDVWGNSGHAETLFQSLLIDFHTRGDNSEYLQTGAAMRLAFYFPDEASQVIADRLKKLDIVDVLVATSGNRVEIWTANGVDAFEFLSSISWSSDRRVAAEVLRICERTRDETMFLACCPGVEKQHDDTVFRRALEFLQQKFIGAEECEHSGCLRMIGERFPDRAKDVFTKYVEINSTRRRQDLCYALQETCGNLSIDLLSPLLSDKTKTHDGIGDGTGAMVEFRICDLAADAISKSFPDLEFYQKNTYEDMDRQIEKLKKQIAKMNKTGK